jgi:hypothetical protein
LRLKLSIVGAVAFGAFLAARCVAYADGVVSSAPPVPAPACDFYENELIGILCARSAYVGTSVEDRQDINRFATDNLGSAFNYNEKDDSTWVDTTGILSVMPVSWLRVTVSSEYNQNYAKTYYTFPELLGNFPYYHVQQVSQSYKSSQAHVSPHFR